jgi:hypothetical protein
MASRVAGAVLALFAAALLAGSVVVVPWWSGHPTFKGVTIKAKEITVGPLGGTGCNVGGDGACMNVPVDATFETLGFALAGVATLVVVVALLVALLALLGRGARKTFAVFAIIGAVIAGALGGALVVIGPQVQTDTPLPLALGLYVFGGGVATALAGSLLAMRKDAPARMQLAPARQSHKQLPHAPAPPPPGVDVHALLAEDTLRPSSLGPEPMLGKQPPPVHSPGGALPGPSGPLGAIGNSGPQPLFSSAPQLRPLYELQGGGIVPKPAANIPLRAPTPIPRDQISAIAGIPTPASIDVPRPVTAAGIPAVTPPPRPAAPPPPPAARGTPSPPAQPPPPPTPPPPGPSQETDRDLLGTARVPKSRTLPPPTRSKPASVAPIAAALPKPAPIVAAPLPAPKPKVPMPAPPRPDTVDDDGSFDGMKTHEATRRPATPRPPAARLLTDEPVIDTDVQAQAIDENLPATESFETSTAESTSFARPGPPTATMQTQPAPPDDDVRNTDAEGVPTVPPPAEPEPAPAVAIAPGVHEGPTDRDKAKPPISTAPQSLPPPTEKQQTTSGPSPACPQCEAPMAWVEAHLRFYCKSCKMYF